MSKSDWRRQEQQKVHSDNSHYWYVWNRILKLITKKAPVRNLWYDLFQILRSFHKTLYIYFQLQDMLDNAYPLARKVSGVHHKSSQPSHSARSKQSTNSAQESVSLPPMSPTPPSQTGSEPYHRPHARRSGNSNIIQIPANVFS